MPESIAVWLATNTAITASGVVATVGTLTTITSVALTAGALAYGNHQRRKQQRQARDAFNASLQDRLVMTATAQAARSRVYGRVRNVDGVLFKHTHGEHKKFYTLVVALAGHEVDGIEDVYFNDKVVELDEDGAVIASDWAPTVRTTTTVDMVVTAGAGSVTLPHTPAAGTTVRAIVQLGPFGNQGYNIPGTLDGNVFSVTGAPYSGTWKVKYSYDSGASKATVRKYTGAPGQDLYDDLHALVGDAVGETDRFEGIACLLVTLQYDQDVFATGVPSISAVVRGAKVYDPRDESTAWTENPALIARDWSLHANGGGCVEAELNAATFVAAANACDVETEFALPEGDPVVLPLYQCGIVIRLDANPDEALSEICEAMAGKWGWAGGKLSVRAGVYRAPVASIGEDWVTSVQDIRITPSGPTAEAINVMRPTYAAASEGYVQTPAPPVRAESYIDADGRELPLEVQLGGVTQGVHVQHVCAVLMREARESLTVELPCNLRAYELELFDVVDLTLPRFGWDAKLFEVVGWRFSLAGGILLTLRETAAAIYTPDAVFDLLTTSPNTGLPRPEQVPAITGLDAESGGDDQADGSALARIRVTWDPVDSEAVRQSGRIEVQVAEVFGGLPDGDWSSMVTVAGSATSADVVGQRIGWVVSIRARAVNTLGMRGPWREIAHTVEGRNSQAGVLEAVQAFDADGVIYSNLA